MQWHGTTTYSRQHIVMQSLLGAGSDKVGFWVLVLGLFRACSLQYFRTSDRVKIDWTKADTSFSCTSHIFHRITFDIITSQLETKTSSSTQAHAHSKTTIALTFDNATQPIATHASPTQIRGVGRGTSRECLLS